MSLDFVQNEHARNAVSVFPSPISTLNINLFGENISSGVYAYYDINKSRVPTNHVHFGPCVEECAAYFAIA